jgi:hypothetical protein
MSLLNREFQFKNGMFRVSTTAEGEVLLTMIPASKQCVLDNAGALSMALALKKAQDYQAKVKCSLSSLGLVA